MAKKPQNVGYLIWMNGCGIDGGTTPEKAVERAQGMERLNGCKVRVTEHDKSKHALGENTDQTYIRDIPHR